MAMPRRDLPTGTVTFLFSDIEGSTRLASQLGPDAFREVLERHNAILRGAFVAHGGVERGTQGDAFLVIFRDAPSAVAAAVDAQRALAAEAWPIDAPIRVRMGLHSGEGIRGGDDYVGIDVNRAARIAAAASGGQVLLSETTSTLAGRSLPPGVDLRDLGSHRLKDLPESERLSQLVIDGLPDTFRPLPSESAAVGSLPARETSLVGRGPQLAELSELLLRRRLVTLTGPGGTGKTSLAIEAARSLAERYEDGAWFVPLDSVSDPGLVATAIVSVLGLRDLSARPAADRLASNLAGRELLLVLDNFEQVLTAAGLVSDLLGAAPRLTVLVTSRAPLHLAAEQIVAVEPLSVPPSGRPVDLVALASVPAVALFVERAGRVRSGFELTLENAEPVADICRRLDGLPLGIELAASRVGLLGPAGVRDRLARQLDLPGAGFRDAPERQRTLRATVAWSHDLLDEPSRRLFARLAVFVGGCDVEQADAVCRADVDDVIGSLATLVDHSLVRVIESGAATRFSLLEPIHDDATARLAAESDSADVARRHAFAYLDLAERLGPGLERRDRARNLERLILDRENLRAAMAWTVTHAEPELALRFAGALGWFWGLTGEIREGRATVRTALEMAGAETPTRARMTALEVAGTMAYYTGDMTEAGRLYGEQLAIAERLADQRAIADALFDLVFTRPSAELQANLAIIDRAEALYQAAGDARGLGRMAWTRGAGLSIAGRTEEARAAWRHAGEVARATDDPRYETLAASSLAVSYLETGDRADAARWFFVALSVSRDIGDVAGIALSMPVAASAALELVGPEPAAMMMGAFESLTRRYGVSPPPGLTDAIRQIDPATRIRAVLDPATYEAALERGRRMAPDEAAAFVFEQVERFPAGTAGPGGPR